MILMRVYVVKVVVSLSSLKRSSPPVGPPQYPVDLIIIAHKVEGEDHEDALYEALHLHHCRLCCVLSLNHSPLR